MPEWLPTVDEPLDREIAELIVAYYADWVGELCAEIQLKLQQHHDDVRIYPYTVKDLRQDWVPEGHMVKLAHVSVVSWSHPEIVRFVQLLGEKPPSTSVDRSRWLAEVEKAPEMLPGSAFRNANAGSSNPAGDALWRRYQYSREQTQNPADGPAPQGAPRP